MAGCWLTQQNRTMAKTLALLFGVIFLVVGALGFVPAATHDVDGMPMLLGIFHVNFVHNVVHLASGAVFLLCGMAGAGASRMFFKIFGIIYAIVAVLGFMPSNATSIMGLMSNNPAVTYLHVALAILMLAIGFAPSGSSSTRTT
jgi:Domain of unknown function (DUF4383)